MSKQILNTMMGYFDGILHVHTHKHTYTRTHTYIHTYTQKEMKYFMNLPDIRLQEVSNYKSNSCSQKIILLLLEAQSFKTATL